MEFLIVLVFGGLGTWWWLAHPKYSPPLHRPQGPDPGGHVTVIPPAVVPLFDWSTMVPEVRLEPLERAA